MSDETMVYNPLAMADVTAQMHSFSQELDDIGQQAQAKLASSREFFSGPHGAEQYAQAQQLIHEGIEDGQRVIRQHGDVIDSSSQNYSGADMTVGNSFGSI
jgi:uncharacterized protein YukE